MTSHLMIDLETLGTDPDCCVVQVGACVFDEAGNVTDRFKSSVKIDDPDNGRISGATLLWWLGQRDSTFRSVTDQTIAVSLWEAMDALRMFAEKNGEARQTWACDPTFDLSILRRCYDRCSISAPDFLNFRRERSCRTVFQVMRDLGLAQVKPDVLHDALADAVAQATNVSRFLQFAREANDAHTEKTTK